MKKKIYAFLVLGILAIGIGSAAIVSYFGLFSTNLNVTQPIGVEGNAEQNIDCISGTTCPGDLITVTNSAPFSIDVQVSSSPEEGIITSYTSDLELTKKTVDFNLDVWEVLGEKVQVEYTLIGEEFSAEVSSGAIEGYELVYYKDNSDRFVNPALAIPISEVSENLPYESDGNADEYDYCLTGEYQTCNGAKIWYIPSDAVTEGVIDWSRASEFYFESKLIQYNSEGEITIYNGLSFTPQYNLDAGLESGNYTITTEVTP